MKNIHFTSVSETLFLPLYARARESQSLNPIISDPLAEDLVNKLSDQFRESDSRLLNAMNEGRIPRKLPVSMGLRSRAFDRYVEDFARRNPSPVIINLGCGLDTRMSRVKAAGLDWYQIDLPAVIELRKEILPPRSDEHLIASSALDFTWMEKVRPENRPVLVCAEGLFMYLDAEGVRALLLELGRIYPGCELIAEVFSLKWVKRLQSRYMQWKFRKQLHMDRSSTFTYGIKDSHEFEAFAPGFSLLGEWSYFDDREPKLRPVNFLGRFRSFRMIQWTVMYRLGGK
ncbi:MAG: class I SAM-dependent methyltransferase [Bacteroidota bacterium]